MREILFRGKRTDNGEWVEGYYCNLGGNHPRVLKENIFIGKIGRVLEFKNIDVIPETVGQYTGVKTYSNYDDELHKIFENDLCDVTEFDREGNNEQHLCQVEFDCGTFYFRDVNLDWHKAFCEIKDFRYNVELIGNIHDDPELLENAAKPAAKNIAQSTLAPATENFELMEG